MTVYDSGHYILDMEEEESEGVDIESEGRIGCRLLTSDY